MDYEKKYKEALERFKAFKEKYYTKDTVIGDAIFDKTGEMQKDFEFIFPELRESIDEKIRKEIINYLDFAESHNLLRATDYEKKKEWLSYLKKLKEQKPNIELIQQSWYMEGYKDRERNREPMWIVKTGEGGPKYEPNLRYGQRLVEEQKPMTFNEPYNPDEYEVVMEGNATSLKRKKQKPDWNEEDEKKIIFLERLIKYNVPEGKYGYKDGSITKSEAIAVLKSLRPVKQEWSEKDEKILIHIQSHLKYLIEHRFKIKEYNTMEDRMILESEIKWLENRFKYLCPIKQEWSEDEEKMRNGLISLIEEIKMQPLKRLEDWDEYLRFLKSLRPSWKPSEKQMNCLCAAVDAAIRKHNESVSGYKPARVLKSLYEDLKKLM